MKPNPLCKNPGRYSWRDAYATEHQVIRLVAAWIVAMQPDYVIETGTYLGDTAYAIGLALADNGHGHLDTLEVNAGNAAQAEAAVRGLPVTVHKTLSLGFTPREKIDFAWLDSRPEHRAEEFRRFYPHMHPACIVGFHDTGPRHKVRPTVDALAEEGLIRPMFAQTWRGVCFAEVL